MKKHDLTLQRTRIVGWLLGAALLGGFTNAEANPIDAVQSAVQSAIQAARDDVQRRARQMGDDATAYCVRRFRSYDPASMTYLGYDGIRHRCP